jgi:tetratricopeptide (TPR) repeat protein
MRGSKMRFRLLIFGLLVPGFISGQSSYDAILKARALTDAGQYTQAIAEVSTALASQKTSTLYITKADAELKSGNYKAAIDDYSRANAIDNSSGESGLSRVYALMGDAAGSLSHLEKNISSPFRKSEKEIMLDPSFEKIENRPEWRLFWKKERYTGAEKGISDIEYFISSGKTDNAVKALAEIKSNYAGTAASDYAETLVYISTGKYQDAVKLLTVLLENDPENVKYLKLLAKGQEGTGNPVGATATYSKLIDLQVPDAELLIKRAECLRKSGETSSALSDIERYLSVYPDNRIALSLAGKLESTDGDNLKAITYFNRNIKLHPGDAQCYIDRADAYFMSKSYDWAGKDYSMSLDLDPGNPAAWLNKGITLLRSGKNDDACHDFRQALSLGNKQAADYISRYCIK